MRRILLAIALAIGLAATSGCFRRSTEPVSRKDAASRPDRGKRMTEVVFAKIKGKGTPAKTNAGAAKGETGTSRRRKNPL